MRGRWNLCRPEFRFGCWDARSISTIVPHELEIVERKRSG